MNNKLLTMRKVIDLHEEKLNKCKTRKCGQFQKEIRKANLILQKEQEQCPRNMVNENECLDKIYLKSKSRKLVTRLIQCQKKKCSKESKHLKALNKTFKRHL